MGPPTGGMMESLLVSKAPSLEIFWIRPWHLVGSVHFLSLYIMRLSTVNWGELIWGRGELI